MGFDKNAGMRAAEPEDTEEFLPLNNEPIGAGSRKVNSRKRARRKRLAMLTEDKGRVMKRTKILLLSVCLLLAGAVLVKIAGSLPKGPGAVRNSGLTAQHLQSFSGKASPDSGRAHLVEAYGRLAMLRHFIRCRAR